MTINVAGNANGRSAGYNGGGIGGYFSAATYGGGGATTIKNTTGHIILAAGGGGGRKYLYITYMCTYTIVWFVNTLYLCV